MFDSMTIHAGDATVPSHSSGDVSWLADEIATLAAHVHAGMARMLSLIGDFDDRREYEDLGMATAAQWLAWRCGMNPRTAREQVRVARSLRTLPLIAAEFARGTLSYAKVRAITRIATVENQPTMLEWAAHATAAQLERVARGVAGVRAASDPARLQKLRSLTATTDENGMADIRIVLPPDEGAIALKAIEVATRQLEEERGGSAEPPEDDPEFDPFEFDSAPMPERRAADALVRIAEGFLQGPTANNTVDRALLIINTDARFGSGFLSDGSAIGRDVLRRLACDAGILRIDTASQSVGRRTRVLPRRMRRALKKRDRGCCYPGCRSTHVDAHHIIHWMDGGETSLENLVLLCRRHHRLIHDFGFSVKALGGGALLFKTPDGKPIRNDSKASSHTALINANAVEGLQMSPTTCATDWDGRHPGYDVAVWSYFVNQAAAGAPQPT